MVIKFFAWAINVFFVFFLFKLACVKVRLAWMSPRPIKINTLNNYLPCSYQTIVLLHISIWYFDFPSIAMTIARQAKMKILTWTDLAIVANSAKINRMQRNDMNRKYRLNWWWIHEASCKMFTLKALHMTTAVECYRPINVRNWSVPCTQTHQKEKVFQSHSFFATPHFCAIIWCISFCIVLHHFEQVLNSLPRDASDPKNGLLTKQLDRPAIQLPHHTQPDPHKFTTPINSIKATIKRLIIKWVKRSSVHWKMLNEIHSNSIDICHFIL